jgi:hypothetical protein
MSSIKIFLKFKKIHLRYNPYEENYCILSAIFYSFDDERLPGTEDKKNIPGNGSCHHSGAGKYKW